MLDRARAVDGFSQNRDKEELLMHLVGAGSLADRLLGKVVTVARHLGSHLGEKASYVHELLGRGQAMMTAFYLVGQLWCESRVSWRLNRCIFKSRVRHRGVLPFKSTIPSAHVVHGLPGKKSDGGFGARREAQDKSAP